MSMENNKKVVISGPLMPSTKDTPIDVRMRVESLEDIANIQLPYVGMVFYVKSEGKHYTVKSLKAKDLNGILVEDALIDQYEEFGTHIDIDLSEFATEELVEELAAEMRENDADIREMIESIADGNGLRGEDGKSAYEIAKEFGFEGSEEEWLESLRGPQGEQGPQGPQGERGFSAYQALKALPQNANGTVEEFIESLRGPMGPQGEKGEQGPQGEVGPMGPQGPAGEKGEAFKYEDFTPEQLEKLVGPQGPKGERGFSAYQAWKTLEGNEKGTVEEFIESLKGEQGPRGEKGEKGDKGEAGLSAYMLAKTYDGFEGSLPEWLDSLKGPAGPQGPKGEPFKYEDFTEEQIKELIRDIELGAGGLGKSAYEIAKEHGFKGTEEEWLESLKGEIGPEGPMGPQGEKGEQGEVGPQGPQGIQGEEGIGVESMLIDEGHLYVTLTNGQLIDAGEIPVNGEGGGSNPEVDKELAATKAELLEARQKLADLTYGVEYEWIYFYEQSSAGSDKLGFNQETAPKFYEDWLPVLETGDDALIEEFIMKVYEEDIYRMYVLRISSEHRLYNRYELIPVEAHSKQPGVSDFIKNWNPTGALTSWNWSGEEDGGFTIDALPSSPLVFAFMKVKEEFRIK